MVQFHGTLDRKTLVQALRLQGRGLTGFALLFVVFGVIGVIGANFHQPAAWGGPLFLLLFGVALIATPWLSARTQLKTNALLAATLAGSADEEQFIVETEFGRSTIPWSKFHRVVIGKKVVLLFLSAAQFHVIADSFFEEPVQWDAFKRLVHQAVPPQSRPKSAISVLFLWATIIVVVFLVWSLFRANS